MATSSPTTSVTDNDSRRRVVRTPIVSAWNGSATATKVLTDNVGLAQHQIWWTSTGATAGTMTISVRPAKGAFFVPIATVNLATTPNGVYFLQAILDDVQFSISGLAGTLAMNGGINSVGIDFTPGGNRSLVDRRRFQVKEVASGWNGAAAITTEAKELEGYSQHQLAIAGGVGNVKLQARPLGANNFVDVNLDTMTVSAGGALIIFPGMYDAFKLVPASGLTGSINAQINSIGQEMFFPITPWQLEATLTGAMIDAALGYVPANPATFKSSYKNAIINGNFDWWQRATSLSASATSRYCADRWSTGGTGSTTAPSQLPFLGGSQDGIVPNNPTFYHRCVVASVAGAGNNALMVHSVEGVRTFSNGTMTVSFWARADASRPMGVGFNQNFGVGGSTTVSIAGQKINLTTTWQYFTLTFACPSTAGTTIGASNCLKLIFWFDAGSNFNTASGGIGQQSGTFDIAQVQLEAGSVATPFEVRPIELELSLCQRYYETTYPIGVTPANNLGNYPQLSGTVYSAGSVRNTYFYKVPKRAAASITFFSSNVIAGSTNGVWQIFNAGAWNTGSTGSMVLAVSTPLFVSFDESFGSGLTVGQAILCAGHLTADCEF